ncbi:hypothetical protein L7F22_025228 [Adiantum nelumboides]|nr:hypothetical protein [Adiantum nelumboides]
MSMVLRSDDVEKIQTQKERVEQTKNNATNDDDPTWEILVTKKTRSAITNTQKKNKPHANEANDNEEASGKVAAIKKKNVLEDAEVSKIASSSLKKVVTTHDDVSDEEGEEEGAIDEDRGLFTITEKSTLKWDVFDETMGRLEAKYTKALQSIVSKREELIAEEFAAEYRNAFYNADKKGGKNTQQAAAIAGPSLGEEWWNSSSAKEGWLVEDVHRLQSSKQVDHKEARETHHDDEEANHWPADRDGGKFGARRSRCCSVACWKPVRADEDGGSDYEETGQSSHHLWARWRASKVRCPLQTIFYQTKKNFNNHYGLDTEGKDPRLLKDSDVSEGDWLSVFSHSKDTSSYRVKCSNIRPEQYEDLLIFYMKVYQKRPTNMEVNVSFARAYVLQFSPRAAKAERSVQFAWAIVGEEHNNDLKKFGHFHTHYLRWKVINDVGDSIVGTVNVEEPNIELTPPPPIAPLASHSLSVQLTDDRTKEEKLRALIEDVQCRLTVAKDEHATCLKKLEAGKVQQLSDEKFGKALSLLDKQINATKLKLASIAEDDPVTRIQLASQLEAQESMQAMLEVGSSEPANVPMLTAEVEFLADVVKEKEMQHNLLREMLHRVEVGRRAYICPPPPSVMSPTLDNFTLLANCAGCGLTFCGKFDFLAANMSCGSSGRSKVFSRVKTEDEPSLERIQVVRNEGIGGEDHGSTADTVNLKPAAASVDVHVTATKVMIEIEWLENKVQDLSAANAEEEKVEEEEAEGDNVEEEAEQQELADANKDIAEVLEDLSSQGFSSAELDLGDDSPLGHFHKVLASGRMLVMWVSCHLYIAVDCSAEAEMHVVWMSKIYCLFAATSHPQQFLVWFNQLNLPIAVEDEVLVLILRPSPPVKKKKRKRQKPAVPIEEIVIDRVTSPLQIDLPNLNQCPPHLANDPRVLILDLNGVLLSHFWPGEEMSKHTKRMTEVAYQNGQRVLVRPGALQFLLWCFDHFTVFVWSCAQVSNVSSLVCKAFPKIWNKFAGRIMSQSQCTRHKGDAKVPKTNKPIFYKELSGFWHGNDKYNASDTLIVDDSAYKCFRNLRHCCIILPKLGAVPEHEFDEFLTEKLVNWL